MEHENARLMPRDWSEYVGQTALKEQLEPSIQAAVANKRTLGHVLLYGPPGYGKTALASLVAGRLGDPFYKVKMPVKPIVLERLFEDWRGGVLFIDEIHNASRGMQEDLMPLLDEGWITVGSYTFEVPWLTVVAATTDRDKVQPALYSRFLDVIQMADYTDAELERIVLGMATKLDVDMGPEEALRLGKAAAGAPRFARRLVLKYRDLVESGDAASTDEVLRIMQIDADGLTVTHRSYLDALDRLGGTAGLSTLAQFLRLHELTVRDLERQLTNLRLITLTPRGRRLTPAGRRRLRGEEEPTFVRRRAEAAG